MANEDRAFDYNQDGFVYNIYIGVLCVIVHGSFVILFKYETFF